MTLDPIPFEQKFWKTQGVLGEFFATKGALEARVRAIVNPAPLKTPLPFDDALFLIDLLRRHPHWEEKHGAGIASLEIRFNYTRSIPQRNVWLNRVDGSEDNISWRWVLDQSQPAAYKLDVINAARHAVGDQIKQARTRLHGTACPICGAPLLDQTDVDHETPLTFDALFEVWLRHRSLTFSDIGVQFADTVRDFADPAQRGDWAEFHRDFAKLRLLHRSEHRGLLHV